MIGFDEGLRVIRAGADLSAGDAERLMGEVLDGAQPEESIAALLTALAQKGESAHELAGFARAMRSRALRIEAPAGAVDTCGTGGSGLPTVNTSTLVAFVLAAADVPVAKHGNRASSGVCGSGDVLDRAGVRIDIPPDACAGLIERTGVAFLFAPLFHPSMKHVAPVRRALGIRTVFNFLGPLCNPAAVSHQLLGVSSPEHAPRMAEALVELGTRSAIVASGSDGLDELTLAAATDLWIVHEADVQKQTVSAEDFGLRTRPFASFAGGDPDTNARIFAELLDGKEGPHADHLVLNAAAGLRVAGVVDEFRDGAALARDLLGSGRVRERFEAYRDASQEVAP